MGDTLIAMSLFASLNQPVHLVTQENSLYTRWKKIFDIGNNIAITETNHHVNYSDPPHPRFLESFKVFSRYLDVDHIRWFDQDFAVGRRGKPAVAIAINNGEHYKNAEFFERIDQNAFDEYPYCKFHSRKVNRHIIDLVQAAGYDVLILDSKDITMENKVYMVNEFCDFVIGYEGGLAHLAHVLKMPSIILPWRLKGNHCIVDFLHLDRRTYLVRDQEEIFSWTPQHLKNLVDQLYNEQGYNNRWITADTFPDPTDFLNYYANGSSQQYYAQLEWVEPYIDRKTLGGY